MCPFDKEFLAALNEAYRSRAYVPVSQVRSYDPEGQRQHAEYQYKTFLASRGLEIEGRRILEVGCGRASLSALLAERAESVVGVDVRPRAEWDALRQRHPNLTLLAQDISQGNPFADNEFDLIVSFVAFEHIMHPYAMLQTCYRLLKPGSQFILHANLYPSAVASHTYRVIHFPYVHLLFSEDVILDYLRETHGAGHYQPVNCLTLAHYEKYFDLIGYQVDSLDLLTRDLDEEFLERFADRLERWPRFDLSLDYFTAYLRKPRHPSALKSLVWDLREAQEALRWAASCDRGRVAKRPRSDGLGVAVDASPGPNGVYVYRELGMELPREPRLGVECGVTGWRGETRLLLGIMVGSEFLHASVPLAPGGEAVAQLPWTMLRGHRASWGDGLPAKALLRFVLRGELAGGPNALLIKRVWI